MSVAVFSRVTRRMTPLIGPRAATWPRDPLWHLCTAIAWATDLCRWVSARRTRPRGET